MLIGKHGISKLIVALGSGGLLLGFLVPRAGAQPLTSFSEKNYSGRYACTESSASDVATAVFKYGPNGGGAYMSGTLIAAEDDFAPAIPSSPSAAFCIYALNVTASSYTISADGHGFEQLVWDLSNGATNLNCTVASFTDQHIIALRNTPNAADVVQRSDFASINMFGGALAGHGTCYK